MRVTVRVFGELTQILNHRSLLELDEGTTVGTLASRIAGEAGLKRQGYLGNFKVGGSELAILVNGRNIALLDGVSTVLEDGDEIVILPPSAGG
jgi:MoaD family protein